MALEAERSVRREEKLLDQLAGRNGTAEFARRSLRNLDFIVASGEGGADVHPVTQAIASLLAILIFPWERSAFDKVKNKRLLSLLDEGWPEWSMSGSRVENNKVKRIGALIKLLRDSVAHGNVTFDSDSRDPESVTVNFEHFPKRGSDPLDWEASIKVSHLIQFCRRISQSLSDYAS